MALELKVLVHLNDLCSLSRSSSFYLLFSNAVVSVCNLIARMYSLKLG